MSTRSSQSCGPYFVGLVLWSYVFAHFYLGLLMTTQRHHHAQAEVLAAHAPPPVRDSSSRHGGETLATFWPLVCFLASQPLSVHVRLSVCLYISVSPVYPSPSSVAWPCSGPPPPLKTPARVPALITGTKFA